MKERNMIISWGAYDWIRGCIVPIVRAPKKYEVVIICRDDTRPIKDCKIELCSEALYAQRSNDLYRIGTELGLTKLTNLMFDEEDLDIDRLTAKLQLSIVLKGVNKIYFSYNELMLTIMSVVNKKLNIPIYSFNNGGWDSENHHVILTEDHEKEVKQKLIDMCVGDYNKSKHIADFEIFHKIP